MLCIGSQSCLKGGGALITLHVESDFYSRLTQEEEATISASYAGDIAWACNLPVGSVLDVKGAKGKVTIAAAGRITALVVAGEDASAHKLAVGLYSNDFRKRILDSSSSLLLNGSASSMGSFQVSVQPEHLERWGAVAGEVPSGVISTTLGWSIVAATCFLLISCLGVGLVVCRRKSQLSQESCLDAPTQSGVNSVERGLPSRNLVDGQHRGPVLLTNPKGPMHRPKSIESGGAIIESILPADDLADHFAGDMVTVQSSLTTTDGDQLQGPALNMDPTKRPSHWRKQVDFTVAAHEWEHRAEEGPLGPKNHSLQNLWSLNHSDVEMQLSDAADGEGCHYQDRRLPVPLQTPRLVTPRPEVDGSAAAPCSVSCSIDWR